MTTQEIASKIEYRLTNLTGSNYFSVEDSNGNTVKIRTSDHSANAKNNGDTKTLSFVSSKTTAESIGRFLSTEWEILENGYTDTYQSIEEILEWELN